MPQRCRRQKFIRYFLNNLIYMTQQAPPGSGGKVSRRDFLKLMAAAGTVMTFAPFVDWGKFLPNPAGNVSERAKVELPDGSQANVKTFRVNHSEAIIYPRSADDPSLNEEAFRTWQFIIACIFGVSGNIGLKKDGKEENVHVMAVCMIH
jgi:hypothetical protein